MAEAFITRRGSAMKVGTAHATHHALTIPDLIGAKNALIGLCPNPQYGNTGTIDQIIVSIVIENGEISSAYYLYRDSSSAGIHLVNGMTFDSTTGTITEGIADFSTVIDYKYVVY